ncbi:TetR-like C-terminal domain-containing protein [Qipengyuania qiaonensis]|uniref:TetR/AcrR family transcriptional regulator C-terminal ligand-binding domain-containing protein n=1 Tax=Qipengyuania qiaonensis TaxID=2867240 RepID=A0ABS7J602_9SPHN|nr:TetR-like C-terminal domain-containing protein [Qipengyuania qiaonensis]MBX7482765.1 TetR/AcrR family transcriptional regulator C-terminal ligand-binding domain-containing protein [Qipengyuania qiaonensis]
MERKSTDQKSRRKPSGAAVIRSDLTRSLHRALFEEWAEYGYAGISLERVAARAGAGKAAIYRRWPSKREFAAGAVHAAGISLSDFSDHGSLEADIGAFLTANRRAFRHPLIRRVLPDLLAERLCAGELTSVVDQIAEVRRENGERLLDRAVQRRELSASIDRELALDLIPSPLYWRMIIRGRPISRAELDRQVTALVAALRVC